MNPGDVVDVALLVIQGMAVALGALIAWIFNNVNNDLKVLNASVVSLNEKVAEIIRAVQTHDAKIGDHGERLARLEIGGSRGSGKNRSRSAKRSP